MMHEAGLFVPPPLLAKTYALRKISGVLYATHNRLQGLFVPPCHELRQSGAFCPVNQPPPPGPPAQG